MKSSADKVICQTPTPGKKPTRIDRWKYDTIRERILDIVPEDADGVELRKLPRLVSKDLRPNDSKRIGSINWYTTVVKLDMEVKGELTRVAGSNPQRLRKKHGL